jgi:hypothetical protein
MKVHQPHIVNEVQREYIPISLNNIYINQTCLMTYILTSAQKWALLLNIGHHFSKHISPTTQTYSCNGKLFFLETNIIEEALNIFQ